jgi:hypothetical protein
MNYFALLLFVLLSLSA